MSLQPQLRLHNSTGTPDAARQRCLPCRHPRLPVVPPFRLQIFQECSVCNPDSPLEALKQTVERLDAAIFAAPLIQHAVRSLSPGCPLLIAMTLADTCLQLARHLKTCHILRVLPNRPHAVAWPHCWCLPSQCRPSSAAALRPCCCCWS